MYKLMHKSKPNQGRILSNFCIHKKHLLVEKYRLHFMFKY